MASLVFVRGRIERFTDDIWNVVEITHDVQVVTIGELNGYEYALLTESDLPVRWAVGEGSFGVVFSEMDLIGA